MVRDAMWGVVRMTRVCWVGQRVMPRRSMVRRVILGTLTTWDENALCALFVVVAGAFEGPDALMSNL